MKDIIEAFNSKNLSDFLAFLSEKYGSDAALSTSLSWEDQVLTHEIASQGLKARIFTLDTGRLFPETYSVLEATRERYKINIEVFFPKHEAVEKLVTEKGTSSFYKSIENRKECCFIRKVEPLNRALENTRIWITGLRAEHSENRKNLEAIEIDEARNIIKVHPLLNWSLEEVKAHIKKHNIPYNSLHDRNFVSIGCQPCTRAIKEGEDFRAGRWWWEDTSKKECGLHAN
jgi:phosphoadenosine phosphosulfate reductase